MDVGSCNTSPSVRELNDSIYELYKPPGLARMQVVFFHGFQLGDINYENAHVTTWQSGDESCIWPQSWLVDEFPGAHILSVSYHGGLRTRKEGNIDNYIRAENIMSDLCQANIGQVVGCPIVLVAHSFGGLVAKDICWHAHMKSSTGNVEEANFLQNVWGLFFYSTPHHGIVPKLAERFLSQGPLLDYVKTLSTDAARRNAEFESLRKLYTWTIAGLGESDQTKVSTFGNFLVVEEASSRYGEDFEILGTDHIFICRPKSKTSKGFYKLTGFLSKFRNRFGAELPAGIKLHYGESLASPRSKYTFKNQRDGNLVVYSSNDRAIWSSGTCRIGRAAGLPITKPRGDLQLLTNGNLVLSDTQTTGLPVWASMSQGKHARPLKLVMQDNGHLVVYDANLYPIWSSVSDKISSGRFIEVDGEDEMPSVVTWLQPYGKLVSRNKKYTFINQGDGNLCLYNPDGACTWASGTSWTQGAGNLYMQRDGNLVLYHDTKGDGAPLWASGTKGRGTGPYKLIMQDDGNLVIYDANSKEIWASNTR